MYVMHSNGHKDDQNIDFISGIYFNYLWITLTKIAYDQNENDINKQTILEIKSWNQFHASSF